MKLDLSSACGKRCYRRHYGGFGDYVNEDSILDDIIELLSIF